VNRVARFSENDVASRHRPNTTYKGCNPVSPR
jgi:hypothetical protein